MRYCAPKCTRAKELCKVCDLKKAPFASDIVRTWYTKYRAR